MRKKLLKKALILFWILLALLILLILINFKVWKYFEKKEIKLIPVLDRCSLIFNTIIHSIKDESSCENYCRSECITRKMKFYSSGFSFSQESCNTCNCYCK